MKIFIYLFIINFSLFSSSNSNLILKISNEELENIPEYSENIFILIIENCTLQYLENISRYKYLEKLIIKDSKIHFFDETFYEIKKLSQLAELSLEGSFIKTIDFKQFRNLRKLQILNLSKNPGIDFSKIYILDKITVLDVSYNDMIIFPMELQKFPNLEELNLDGNKITELPNNIISVFLKLKKISINGNPLKHILENLRPIIYSNKQIENIQKTTKSDNEEISVKSSITEKMYESTSIYSTTIENKNGTAATTNYKNNTELVKSTNKIMSIMEAEVKKIIENSSIYPTTVESSINKDYNNKHAAATIYNSNENISTELINNENNFTNEISHIILKHNGAKTNKNNYDMLGIILSVLLTLLLCTFTCFIVTLTIFFLKRKEY